MHLTTLVSALITLESPVVFTFDLTLVLDVLPAAFRVGRRLGPRSTVVSVVLSSVES